MRAFQPQLSPYTTAVASGSIRVVGELADIDHLLVDATVERLDVRLFDYALRNARPIHIALRSSRCSRHRHAHRRPGYAARRVRSRQSPRLTDRDSHDGRRQPGRAAGFRRRRAELAAWRALSATLEGPLEDPAVSGTLDITNGRIRHFALPHALENISGTLRFDTRGVTLDGLTGRLARGDVTFGGRIDKQGYLPGQIDITMTGTGMRLQAGRGHAVARGCAALAAGHDAGGDAVGSRHGE